MQSNTFFNIGKLNKENRRRKAWHRVVLALGCVVLFVSVYALILPAITVVSPNQVLSCPLNVHSHSDECFGDDGELLCMKADFVVHKHDDKCFDKDGNKVCTLEEVETHEHSDDCYKEEKKLVCGFSETDEEHEHSDGCYETVRTLICGKEEIKLHSHSEECFDEDGNLICESLEVTEHVHGDGCFKDTVKDAEISKDTAEDPVETEPSEDTEPDSSSDIKKPTDDTSGEPYDTVDPEPENTDAEQGGDTSSDTESQDTVDDNGDVSDNAPDETYSAVFRYEDEYANIKVNVAGTVTVSDKNEKSESGKGITVYPEDDSQKLVMVLEKVDENGEDYSKIENFALYSAGDNDLAVLEAWKVRFLSEGEEADMSRLNISAVIEPKKALISEANSECADILDEAVPDANAGIVASAISGTPDNMTAEKEVLLSSVNSKASFEVSVDENDGIIAMALAGTPNPNFTVQYFTNFVHAAESGSNPLPIINTAGGKLPVNGNKNLPLKYLYLKEVKSGTYKGKFQVDTTLVFKRVYSDLTCDYVSKPNINYFNRLYENKNYNISQVWVLKPGRSAESTNSNDWDIYDPSTVHFTNRSAVAGGNVVLISENSVIRLVFETKKGVYTNAVNMYDYDITNDGIHTYMQGINIDSNYTKSGTHLAFGNANSGTGLHLNVWSNKGNNYLNKYNGNSYAGCTFGLVSGLSNGKIQYSNGVSAPNLFNDGTANGKTSYDKGQYSLNFDQIGDTYILSGISGAGLSGLRYFNHPTCGSTTYTGIWTNNFWPMDSVKNKDPKSGENGNRGTFKNPDGSISNYPPSDDGIAHNNMFGMQYAVNFTLNEYYTGPLEYYFYGDDDMWVFLNDRLICDIGGVHSSVGEYVNLWDYIPAGSSGTYTLSFFYTERGLSGSSCYMMFTLPSVSSVSLEQNTGSLTVKKTVEGPHADVNDEEFVFDISLHDANGNALLDDYSYTRYGVNGNIIETDLIIYEGGSFKLKNGEYIVINCLPFGVHYTITERSSNYIVQNSVNGEPPKSGTTAQGSIVKNENASVDFINISQYVLPHTGGSGIAVYEYLGTALALFAVLSLALKLKKKEHERTLI